MARIEGLQDKDAGFIFRRIFKAAAMTATPATATDEQIAGLRKNLSDAQLVEQTSAIASENYRVRFNRGFDVADQGFSDGAVYAVPDRSGLA